MKISIWLAAAGIALMLLGSPLADAQAKVSLNIGVNSNQRGVRHYHRRHWHKRPYYRTGRVKYRTNRFQQHDNRRR